MTFKLKNTLDGTLYVGDLVFSKYEEKTVDYITSDVLTAVNKGDLTSSPAITALTVTGDLENTMSTVTDSSTGTAATITNKAVTVAAITDVATTANAVSTLLVELAKAKDMITVLTNRVEVLQKLAGI